jgi:putative ABC transport system permease protein
MVWHDLIRDVLRTLWANKLRTFLTMFGIAWGIVSIVLMVGAGEGLRKGQEKQALSLGRDLLIVFHGRTSMQAGGARAGRAVSWETPDIPVVQEESPDCENVLPELERGDVRAHSNYNNGAFTVTGSYPPFAYVRSLDIAGGRFYNWEDQNQGRRVAFVGSDSGKQLFPTGNAIGDTVYLNEIPYTVIGIMSGKKQNSSYDGWDVNKIFIPFSAMQRDFPDKPPDLATAVDQILVTPKSLAQHLACEHEIRASLARLHKFDPRDKEAVPIWDTVKNAKAFAQMTDGMKYFLGAVGVVTLLLGGLGVMNVMMVAVRERTREIGVRKAIGAPARTILKQFFFEALLIAGLSGAIGMGVAYGFCALVNLLPMPPFFAGLVASWSTGLIAAGILGTIAVLASLYPARKAAAIDPIEALRYEAGG